LAVKSGGLFFLAYLENMEMKMYKVTLYRGDKVVMQTTHDYRPYAESQAKTWRAMYGEPEFHVVITHG
jgi:hypothetical protein